MKLWIKLIILCKLELKFQLALHQDIQDDILLGSFYRSTESSTTSIHRLLQNLQVQIQLQELDDLFNQLCQSCNHSQKVLIPCLVGLIQPSTLARRFNKTTTQIRQSCTRLFKKLETLLLQKGHTMYTLANRYLPLPFVGQIFDDLMDKLSKKSTQNSPTPQTQPSSPNLSPTQNSPTHTPTQNQNPPTTPINHPKGENQCHHNSSPTICPINATYAKSISANNKIPTPSY